MLISRSTSSLSTIRPACSVVTSSICSLSLGVCIAPPNLLGGEELPSLDDGGSSISGRRSSGSLSDRQAGRENNGVVRDGGWPWMWVCTTFACMMFVPAVGV